MDIQIDRQRIVNKFKRNGHYLTKTSLQLLTQHLTQINNPNKRLDDIIKKINEMCIIDQQQFNDTNLKLALQLITHKTQTGKSFNSYDTFLEHLKKWTITYVSPYETNQLFFVDKPDPALFGFQPADFIKMNTKRFKSIRDHNAPKLTNKTPQQFKFIGVLYQKFLAQRTKIMLQNQINQVQLVFPPGYQHQIFLIPGCTYIAQGDLKSKDLQLNVRKLHLPAPLISSKNSLFNLKLRLVCDNISLSKEGLDYTVEDFRKYEIIYNKAENKSKPVLVFGNVKINVMQIANIRAIVKKYPVPAQCLILMLSQQQHQQLDLKKQLSDTIPIYLIPHINSQGPRILPKIPILKTFHNCKILTNPARLCIQGKQCLFLNYPLIKNFHARNLIQREAVQVNAEEMVRKVAAMLYSQNNVAITNKIFWRQSQYFDINSEDVIFICDKACSQTWSPEGKGGIVSVGNYQRETQFVCFFPHIKDNLIQLCDNKEQ